MSVAHRSDVLALPPTPLAAGRPAAARAELRELHGRMVAWAEVDGLREGGTGEAEAEVVGRALELAEQLGCPVVIQLTSVAVDPGPAGIAGLAAWGRVAARAVRLSGVVPLLVAVSGPVHGGLAPILGLADHVVIAAGATAYLNGPGPIAHVTGATIDSQMLGGAHVHATRTGLSSLTASDADDALDALVEILTYLPDNHLAAPPTTMTDDPIGRACTRAAAIVPAESMHAYDVRDVLDDVFDAGSLLELHGEHAANLVCAYARLGGQPVAVVANQPAVRAGTLDIAASKKGARHIQGADALGLPLITFVDTPGFEPGRDLEWRGMIRHGAKLVGAYANASVPRVGVILRKAYGGAYIVMDSHSMGNDLTFAWPTAEIAVMGAPGAVAILNKRDLADAEDPIASQVRLEAEYRARYCSPTIAAERGYVDAVIDPVDTRRLIAGALRRLANKRPTRPHRAHDNGPL
jgi:acetyl-CoA carboxylase carboxyltransferase component